MEVRKFISDVLVDIVNGVKDAQIQEGVGGYIAPDGIGTHSFPRDSGVLNETRIVSTVVKFDMAVTAETAKSGGGGAKVRVAVL